MKHFWTLFLFTFDNVAQDFSMYLSEKWQVLMFVCSLRQNLRIYFSGFVLL